jgi:cyclopropane fatty-acyl-phospholipid synthase-like methyltransferase
MRLRFPATARNRDPILAVLRDVLPAKGDVLEIASGSGEHVVHFAAALPGLRFFPTDVDPEAIASIDAWREHENLTNVMPAIALDVRDTTWPIDRVDVILCSNMIHISPWEATIGLLDGAARIVPAGGLLVLYGPFMLDGKHTADSNAAFDASLRARDPAWGVRDLRDVEKQAEQRAFGLVKTVQMPANNLTAIFRRSNH